MVIQVAEGGENLSVGQRQLVCLTRSPFSFNFQICELIRVVKNCIFCSELIIDFSDKMTLSVYS